MAEKGQDAGDWDGGLLTERETTAARYAAGGWANAQIAEALGITERTVKAHLSAVFEKLGVSDRLQLALLVHGISSPSESRSKILLNCPQGQYPGLRASSSIWPSWINPSTEPIMANSSPAVVTELTGRAWIRNSDGSLTELHQGSKVPAGSDVVTASGATVALQVENGMPIVIGEGRQVAMNGDVSGALPDPTEAAVTPPKGTDSERLLAALQSGQDPFEVLDPTAAVVSGGPGDDGGGSFVRLARILKPRPRWIWPIRIRTVAWTR